MNAQLAFLGLGQMGRPMARNLLKACPALLIRAADTEACRELQSHGAFAATSSQEFSRADIVFLCLPDEQAVRQLLFGTDGIAPHLRQGSIIVDTSTISYTQTLSIARELADLGIHLLDAPVSGMAARAIDGTLTAMCGGSRDIFEAARPYLERVACNILYMGETGTGQLAKLINQLLFDINCAALAEIMPMAVKLGLDAPKMAAIVNTGTGRSYASEFFLPRILEDNFSEGYSMEKAYKDLVSGAELGARMRLPLPVLAAATVTYQTALLQGHGACNKGAMIKVYEALLDVRFREQKGPNLDA